MNDGGDIHCIFGRGLSWPVYRGVGGGNSSMIRLKTRIGPVTDLRTKRLLETTASLMSAIGQHHRDRIMTKAKRWLKH